MYLIKTFFKFKKKYIKLIHLDLKQYVSTILSLLLKLCIFLLHSYSKYNFMFTNIDNEMQL